MNRLKSDITSSHSTIGMMDLNSVPKLDKPIKEIPGYVFGNCNQVTCHDYSRDELADLRLKSVTMTPAALEDEVKDEKARIVRGEEYDWIYGLGELEKMLSDPNFLENPAGAFTTDDIIRINGLFSRLCTSNGHVPGKFRQQPIYWSKRDLNPTEILTRGLFELEVQRIYKAEEAITFTSRISNPHCELPTCPIKASWLREKLTRFQQGKEVALDPNGNVYDRTTINPRMVDEWVKQFGCNEKGKVINGKKKITPKYIDIAKWAKAHIHFFPPEDEIVPELQNTLCIIQDKEMHPIEKVGRLWFDIVRIHISHEANKRSGKALGSLIALAFGYLPPKIGEEDKNEYIKTMEEGFEMVDGHIPFVNFVARKMTQAYVEYGALYSEA